MRDSHPEGLAVHPRGARADTRITAPRTWRRCASSCSQLLPNIDLPIALHRGEAVAALARSEHVGVPIDMEVFSQLADKTDLAGNPRQHGAAGRRARHLRPRQGRLALEPSSASSNGLASEGISGRARRTPASSTCGARPSRAWPRLIRGRAAAAAALHPRQAAHDPAERRTRQPKQHGVVAVLVEDLAHAAEGEALDFLAVGVAAISDQAGARTRRSPTSTIRAWNFWRAAALSDGHSGPSNPMLDLYRSGDPYLNFGKIIGYIPPDATRETPGIEAIRDRLKVLCLGGPIRHADSDAGDPARRLGDRSA